MEHALRPPQQGAALLERLQGTDERRRSSVAGNAIDIGQLLSHSLIERGSKVLAANLIEPRHAVRQRALLQQGVHLFRMASVRHFL
jgi:hypothetical protein